jgi:radical SAM enzyme (rSAM/lipoprotein system)
MKPRSSGAGRRGPGLGLRRTLSLELLRRYRDEQARLHPLHYLVWECTLRCDLACGHCGSDCRPESATPDMPLADFLRVLGEVKGRYDPSSVMVGITGGEPLMRADLADCGRAISELGFHWGMVSNGYSMTKARLASLLDAGLSTLSLSLDGLEASHERLRGKSGSFARTLRAIEAAAAAPGLVLDVVTCVNRANFSELPALRELLLRSGVKRWRLASIFPRGRAAGSDGGRAAATDWLRLDANEYRGLMDAIASFRRLGGIDASYGCEGFLGPYEGEVRGYYFFCRSGINFASVLVDGSIGGCTSERRDFLQGTVYDGSFLRAWDEGFRAHRDRAWTARGACAGCSSYRYCLGNGLHLWNSGAEGPARCGLDGLEPGPARYRGDRRESSSL